MLKFSELIGGKRPVGAANPPADPPKPEAADPAEVARLCCEGEAPALAAGLIESGATIAEVEVAIDRMGKIREIGADAAALGSVDTKALAEAAISAGTSVADFRAQVFDALADAQSPEGAVQSRIAPGANRPKGGETFDNPSFFREAAAGALYAQLAGREPEGAARDLAGMTLGAICREYMNRAGHGGTVVRGGRRAMNSDTAAVTAMFALGQQGRDDFVPALTGDLANRAVREAYDAPDTSILDAAREITAYDFRAKHLAGVGEFGELKKVNEHGEFTRAPVASEGGELLRVETWGVIHSITRQGMVDGALMDLFGNMARAGVVARDHVCGKIADLLASNPTYFDGTALFHADHANLAASGGEISVATVSAARAAMRQQTDVSGRVKVRIEPWALVVAPGQETAAQQVVAAITPDQGVPRKPVHRHADRHHGAPAAGRRLVPHR